MFTPTHPRRVPTVFLIAALAVLTGCATGTEKPAAAGPTVPAPRTTEYPWMSVATWREKHAEDVAIAAAGGIDLLFVGDSITEGWAWGEGAVWQQHFAAKRAANFGIGGDLTQNVLWRLQNGATGALRPKAVVLLIGTNNLDEGDSPAATAEGIAAVVAQLRTSFPGARILLLGVFPTRERPDDPMRARVAAVNAALAPLDDGASVFYRDIGPVFLAHDGTIPAAVMPDFLHLSEEGYRRWAAAILPTLDAWLGEP